MATYKSDYYYYYKFYCSNYI